jgi:hypothetical protein
MVDNPHNNRSVRNGAGPAIPQKNVVLPSRELDEKWFQSALWAKL